MSIFNFFSNIFSSISVILLLASFLFIHPASYVLANIYYDSKRMALLEKHLELARGQSKHTVHYDIILCLFNDFTLLLSVFFLFTQVAVIICSLLRYTCSVYNFMLKTEMIDFLQKEDFKLSVDLSPIFFCEQVGQSSLIHYTVFLLSHYEKMT